MPRLSIRVDLGPGLRIGPGKIALLEAIDATGSISAAGRKLGMSYRRAWLPVEEVNRTFAQPGGSTPTRGGDGGGGPPPPPGRGAVPPHPPPRAGGGRAGGTAAGPRSPRGAGG